MRHVLESFLDFISTLRNPAWIEPRKQARGSKDPYGSMYLGTLQIIRLASVNKGMFKCLLQFGSGNDDITSLWRSFSNNESVRAAARVLRSFPQLDRRDLEFRATLMGGMVDEFSRNYFIFEDPDIVALCDHKFERFSDLAVYLTDIWYTTLVGKHPGSAGEFWRDSFA